MSIFQRLVQFFFRTSTTHEESTSPVFTWWMVIFLVGIAAGVGGMLLVLLLHAIQHIAYGYSLTQIISDESYLEGVSAALPLRRLYVLIVCGLVAGVGWWCIERFGKPLVSLAQAIKPHQPQQMPFGATIAHAILQIVTIALGSPLGREVAPREVGALFAGWLARRMRINEQETRILLACGAGAGLAAVYNIPLSGALFTLEVLLHTFRWRALIPAMATAAIATVVSWIGLGREHQYLIANLDLTRALVVWSICVGPLIGIGAYYFNRLTQHARNSAPHDWRLPVLCVLNFTLLGLLAMYFPALLGNGKGAVQIGFNVLISAPLALILLVLRVLIVWSSLRAGARGGLLTPSLANGALLAILLSSVWCVFFPDVSQVACAVIGATAFLAASQKMPITAIVMIFELTNMPLNLLMPILLAVIGAVACSKSCS